MELDESMILNFGSVDLTIKKVEGHGTLSEGTKLTPRLFQENMDPLWNGGISMALAFYVVIAIAVILILMFTDWAYEVKYDRLEDIEPRISSKGIFQKTWSMCSLVPKLFYIHPGYEKLEPLKPLKPIIGVFNDAHITLRKWVIRSTGGVNVRRTLSTQWLYMKVGLRSVMMESYQFIKLSGVSFVSYIQEKQSFSASSILRMTDFISRRSRGTFQFIFTVFIVLNCTLIVSWFSKAVLCLPIRRRSLNSFSECVSGGRDIFNLTDWKGIYLYGDMLLCTVTTWVWDFPGEGTPTPFLSEVMSTTIRDFVNIFVNPIFNLIKPIINIGSDRITPVLDRLKRAGHCCGKELRKMKEIVLIIRHRFQGAREQAHVRIKQKKNAITQTPIFLKKKSGIPASMKVTSTGKSTDKCIPQKSRLQPTQENVIPKVTLSKPKRTKTEPNMSSVNLSVTEDNLYPTPKMTSNPTTPGFQKRQIPNENITKEDQRPGVGEGSLNKPRHDDVSIIQEITNSVPVNIRKSPTAPPKLFKGETNYVKALCSNPPAHFQRICFKTTKLRQSSLTPVLSTSPLDLYADNGTENGHDTSNFIDSIVNELNRGWNNKATPSLNESSRAERCHTGQQEKDQKDSSEALGASPDLTGDLGEENEDVNDSASNCERPTGCSKATDVCIRSDGFLGNGHGHGTADSDVEENLGPADNEDITNTNLEPMAPSDAEPVAMEPSECVDTKRKTKRRRRRKKKTKDASSVNSSNKSDNDGESVQVVTASQEPFSSQPVEEEESTKISSDSDLSRDIVMDAEQVPEQLIEDFGTKKRESDAALHQYHEKESDAVKMNSENDSDEVPAPMTETDDLQLTPPDTNILGNNGPSTETLLARPREQTVLPSGPAGDGEDRTEEAGIRAAPLSLDLALEAPVAEVGPEQDDDSGYLSPYSDRSSSTSTSEGKDAAVGKPSRHRSDQRRMSVDLSWGDSGVWYPSGSLMGNGNFDVMLAFASFGQAGPARSISHENLCPSSLLTDESFDAPARASKSANFPLMSSF